MNIDDLTVGQVKSLAGLIQHPGGVSHPFKIGEIYFIRTVTHYLTGRVQSVGPQELVLTDAAWIADTGRFADGLKGEFKEIEPFPDGDVIVGRGSIVDAVIYRTTPRTQK